MSQGTWLPVGCLVGHLHSLLDGTPFCVPVEVNAEPLVCHYCLHLEDLGMRLLANLVRLLLLQHLWHCHNENSCNAIDNNDETCYASVISKT